jgi:hypothetical protein
MNTFQTKLAHLTFRRACKLLGPEGEKMIRRGGKFEIDIDLQTTLNNGLFRLLLDRSVVEITPDSPPHHLRIRCSTCAMPCDHQGAALALILEDKMALGLAAPRPERVPVESLSNEELVKQAIDERRERAQTEKMELQSLEPASPWTDYTITSKVSGKTYRVALRGWERGDSIVPARIFARTPSEPANTSSMHWSR